MNRYNKKMVFSSLFITGNKKKLGILFLFVLFGSALFGASYSLNTNIHKNKITNENNKGLQSTETSIENNIVNSINSELSNQPRSAATASWTFMVYLDADNNLEDAGIKDLNEMETVGSSTDVNIIVQMDRAEGYDTSNGDWTDAKRFYVERDTSASTIGSTGTAIGEVNMGDEATLEAFIDWAQTNYPANNYALILWDHGSGVMWGPSQGGIAFDDASGSDYLTEQEILTAITGKGIDLIGFDACLMGSTEFWYALNSEVDVLVGSEKTEPGDGWPYDTILNWLTTNPSATADQLGDTIVQKYHDFYAIYNLETTQSAGAANQIPALEDAVSTLATKLSSQIGNYKSALQDIRNNQVQEYDDEPYIDLYDLAGRIATDIPDVSTEATAVQTAINNVIINSLYTGSLSMSHGLTIYFPATASEFSNTYRYTNFGIDSSWDEFLLNYFDAPIDDDQFEDNDNISTAAPIRPTYYSNLICDDDDYYSIDIKENQQIFVSISFTYQASVADLDLKLIAENGSTIISSETKSDSDSLNWIADANQTLFIYVYNVEIGSKITYSLSVYIPVDDDLYEENDDFATATDINSLVNTTITNLVCIDVDYYMINVTGGDALVDISLEFIAAEGILSLEIWQWDGGIDYAKLDSIGTADDNIYYYFGAVDNTNTGYYIVVLNYENNTNYNLSVVVDYGADDSYDDGAGGNDYINTATTLTMGTYTDLVCIDDDLYNITLTEGTWLNASIFFNNNEGDLDLYLYDPDLNQVAASWYWEDNEMITYYVNRSGTYVLDVYPYEINLHYNLTLRDDQTFRLDQFDGTNENWDQIDQFPTLQEDMWYLNMSAWDDDYYHVTLDKNQEVVFDVQYNETEGTLAILLYDSDQNLLDYSFTTALDEIGLEFKAPYSGDYYIEVIPFQRLDRYDLIYTAIPSFSVYTDQDQSLIINYSITTDFLEDLLYGFNFDFGDNETVEQLGITTQISHTYSEPGTYTYYIELLTTYGIIYYTTANVFVYSQPHSFNITLDGDQPVTTDTFSISWDRIIDADEIYIYVESNPFTENDTDTLTPVLSEQSNTVNGADITVEESGTYYCAVVYKNPLGKATSNILAVQVDIGNGTSDNTKKIDGFLNMGLIAIFGLITITIIARKKKAY